MHRRPPAKRKYCIYSFYQNLMKVDVPSYEGWGPPKIYQATIDHGPKVLGLWATGEYLVGGPADLIV